MVSDLFDWMIAANVANENTVGFIDYFLVKTVI